jgi:hypothetical protein
MVAEERRGKGWVRRVIGVVGRVYETFSERARKCAKAPLFRRRIYNAENDVKLSILMITLMMSCAVSQSTDEPWRLGMETSGGITGKGTGSWSISSDGKVEVRSMSGTACSDRATEDELRRIDEALAAAKPDSWSESYVPEERCCDRIEYVMTIDTGRTKRTVTWIDDPRPMPSDLRAVIEALQGIRAEYVTRCRP